ncbi:hypothetical protein O4J56_06850 [Nocardiopsis sp. RSe5-2]|uniref:Uncharacterized protein n=1 Tax=Nocardiopsis endophytica TaxID=3018445 RepID=A0ABT4U077_9ACTN|nr:hypothetical protein [Nocardiopsis endophytica]MDA2810353.1 hypothetical protein [Nocardiopsis endophytica]
MDTLASTAAQLTILVVALGGLSLAFLDSDLISALREAIDQRHRADDQEH